MKAKISNAIFSHSGTSITIGVVGFIAAISSIFIDLGSHVSIKWILLILLVFCSLGIIFLKLIYDLSKETSPPPPYETPFDYVVEENVFVIRRNENFINSIIVGCYVRENEIDRLAYLGVVHIVQDKVIQIRIKHDFKILPKIPKTILELERILVRPVVPTSAIPQLSNLENTND